MLGHDCAVVKT